MTGATGIVGWNIVRVLRAHQHEVRILIRDEQRARKVLPPDINYLNGDLRNSADIERAVDGCETGFHATCLLEQWLKDESLLHTVNVGGTEALVVAALKTGVSSFGYTRTIDMFARKPSTPFDTSELAVEPLDVDVRAVKQLAHAAVVSALAEQLPQPRRPRPGALARAVASCRAADARVARRRERSVARPAAVDGRCARGRCLSASAVRIDVA
jgi:dihydroflavonol-4-reductase